MSSTGGSATVGSTPNSPGSTSSTGATGAATAAAISTRLATFLDITNGTDAYDSRVVAVGRLSTDQYLKVPDTLSSARVDPKFTGRNGAHVLFTNSELVATYAMNKACFGTDERAIKLALLRTYAVSLGWYTRKYEVSSEPAPADAATTMDNDFDAIQRYSEMARLLASLLPFAAEFVFRTMGHHYLTGLSSEYETKYQKFFNACVQPNLTSYLAPADLYHTALHWVSLTDSLAIASSPEGAAWLPHAVVIRASAAPAGTALIATSVAILDAMEGTGLKEALITHSGADIPALTNVGTAIKKKPSAYHVIPSAYGQPALSGDAKTDFEEAKAIASKLAPVLQGFLDALPNSSTLAQARALAKHADANPILRKKAKVFFKEVGSVKAASIEELFSADKRSKAAVKNDTIDEDED